METTVGREGCSKLTDNWSRVTYTKGKAKARISPIKVI